MANQFTAGTETKPAVYSTEFWVTMATQLLGFVQLLGVTSANIPDKWVLIIQGVVAGLYTLSRGAAKSGVKPG